MLLVGVVQEARRAQLYTNGALPLPIVIKVHNAANGEHALASLFKIISSRSKYRRYHENLALYFNIISREDLIFEYSGDIYETERLLAFLTNVRQNLEKLKGRLPNNLTIYLAYIGPASVGIAVGTMLRTYELNIFQHGKSGYHETIVLRDRSNKESTHEYKRFFRPQYKRIGSKHVTVCVDVSSHKINRDESSITSFGDSIYMRSRNGGTIGQREDWLQYCREVFRALNEAQQQYEEIRLVYSIPVSLGVAIGAALHNYWPIVLTNYDKDTGSYRNLLRLNQIDHTS